MTKMVFLKSVTPPPGPLLSQFCTSLALIGCHFILATCSNSKLDWNGSPGYTVITCFWNKTGTTTELFWTSSHRICIKMNMLMHKFIQELGQALNELTLREGVRLSLLTGYCSLLAGMNLVVMEIWFCLQFSGAIALLHFWMKLSTVETHFSLDLAWLDLAYRSITALRYDFEILAIANLSSFLVFTYVEMLRLELNTVKANTFFHFENCRVEWDDLWWGENNLLGSEVPFPFVKQRCILSDPFFVLVAKQLTQESRCRQL